MQIAERSTLKINSWNPEKRTVQAIVATESPIQIWSAGGRVDEILLMEGADVPQQVPLLDTHSRESTSKVLGSASNFQIKNDELHATITLSKEAGVDGAAVKVQEGHLTDLSVGYVVEEAQFIPEGQTYFYNGRAFSGPVQLASKWRIKEISLCPIGADIRAKIRSDQNIKGENIMEDVKTIDAGEEARIRAEERLRVSEISMMCQKFECEQLGQGLINSGASVDQARAKIMDYVMKTKIDLSADLRAWVAKDPYGSVEMGRMDYEKRADAVVDGLIVRAGGRVEKPAPGFGDFTGHSLVEIARDSLQAAGLNPRSWNASRVVKEALQLRTHSTSDFPHILANVSNKALREEYELAPGTFKQWVSEVAANDFKEMSRTQLSEAPDLDEVPEGMEYKFGSFGESREVYKIITLGKMFSITRQAIINDDLGAFVRVPRAFAMSAKRAINKAVYDILIDNDNMSDNVALFHESTHKNLAGSAAAISVVTLSAARTAMRTQTGLSGAILNIAPKFLIVPAALETSADQLLNTMSGLEATEGAGAHNPFYKRLELVVEPLLDADSGKPYFMAADPRQFDTIEVAFLHGQNTPYLESRDGWNIDGCEYKARIDFGCKALDWRGLYKTDSTGG